MISSLEQIKQESWKKFFLLQKKIFLISYKDFLDNFNEKLNHPDKEIISILFLKLFVDNFELIENNLEKNQIELNKEIENQKQIFVSSKENIEILNLSNKFVKNIKKLDENLEKLIILSFFIISLSLIKNWNQQEEIMVDFTKQEINSTLKNKNDKKQFYNLLEKSWKDSTNKLYDEIVEKENNKTISELEKSAFISFNYFNTFTKK